MSLITTTKHVAAERRYDEVDGVRWYTRVIETSQPVSPIPVVFIQGMVVSSAFHLPLMGQLQGEFRMYAPDLPGYGQSDQPEPPWSHSQLIEALARWQDQAELNPMVLVGSSYGAQVAADFAARYPERVSRLALISPVLEPAARPLPALLRRWNIEAAREWKMWPLMTRDYLKAGPRRSLLILRAVRSHRMEEVAPRIQVPTLIIRGARDPLVSNEWVERLVELLPQGRLTVIPGADHPCNYTQPLEVSRVLRPFLVDDE